MMRNIVGHGYELSINRRMTFQIQHLELNT